VTSIRLPALRERPDDISRIVDHLNARLAQKYACPAKRITPDVVDALLHYAWPGNVRELQNVFEGLFALSDNGLIDRSVLPEELVSAGREASSPAALPAAGLNGARLEDLEQQAILSAVSNAKGNISQAARALGISRSTLYVKLGILRGRADGLAHRH